jgi:hypothetical protein
VEVPDIRAVLGAKLIGLRRRFSSFLAFFLRKTFFLNTIQSKSSSVVCRQREAWMMQVFIESDV